MEASCPGSPATRCCEAAQGLKAKAEKPAGEDHQCARFHWPLISETLLQINMSEKEVRDMDGEHKHTEGAFRHFAAGHKCSLILMLRSYMGGSCDSRECFTSMPCCTSYVIVACRPRDEPPSTPADKASSCSHSVLLGKKQHGERMTPCTESTWIFASSHARCAIS